MSPLTMASQSASKVASCVGRSATRTSPTGVSGAGLLLRVESVIVVHLLTALIEHPVVLAQIFYRCPPTFRSDDSESLRFVDNGSLSTDLTDKTEIGRRISVLNGKAACCPPTRADGDEHAGTRTAAPARARPRNVRARPLPWPDDWYGQAVAILPPRPDRCHGEKIGRASCRERG